MLSERFSSHSINLIFIQTLVSIIAQQVFPQDAVEILDLLVALSSGFLFNEEEWDRLELLIEKSILVLEKKYDLADN